MINDKTTVLVGLLLTIPAWAAPQSVVGSATQPVYGPGVGWNHCMSIAIGQGEHKTGTGHVVAQGGHALAICHATSQGQVDPCPPLSCQPHYKKIQRVVVVQNTQDTLIAIHHTKRLQAYLQPSPRLQSRSCTPIDWSTVGITLP